MKTNPARRTNKMSPATLSPAVWVVIAALILVNAFYVSAEFGAVGVRRSRIRRLGDDGNGLARRLLPYIETPARPRAATSPRRRSASRVSSLIARRVRPGHGRRRARAGCSRRAWASTPIARATPPRSSCSSALDGGAGRARRARAQVARAAVPDRGRAGHRAADAVVAARLPAVHRLLINGATPLLLRLLGATPAAQRHLHSPDEIELLIAESRDGGLLEPDEQQRLHRALRLGLRTARDLMVPLEPPDDAAVDLAVGRRRARRRREPVQPAAGVSRLAAITSSARCA